MNGSQNNGGKTKGSLFKGLPFAVLAVYGFTIDNRATHSGTSLYRWSTAQLQYRIASRKA